MEYLRGGDGNGKRRIRIGQNEIVVTLTGADTGGAFSLCEYTMPPTAASPPPHFHEETYEAFYVLQGRLRCTIDGETFEAGPGETVSIPPEVVHSFSSIGAEPARFLLLIAPAGFEGYFVELGEFVEAAPKPIPRERIQRRAAELCEVYDQTVLDAE